MTVREHMTYGLVPSSGHGGTRDEVRRQLCGMQVHGPSVCPAVQPIAKHVLPLQQGISRVDSREGKKSTWGG